MTNKEAIEQLKIIKESLMNCGGCEGARQSLTCIYLAIKALEQVDLIRFNIHALNELIKEADNEQRFNQP